MQTINIVAYTLAAEAWPGQTHITALLDTGGHTPICGTGAVLFHRSRIVAKVDDFDRSVPPPARCQKCRARLREATTN